MAKKSDVGYGKPPMHTRFKPGQSGNPRGRPRGSLNFITDLKKTLQSPVALNEAGRSKRVSTQQAALLRLREKALKGDTRALDKLLSLAATMNVGETSDASQRPSADDQSILDAFRRDVLVEAIAARANDAEDT
ncbi:DUF5681 domain-containing protein [Bradyrhizobium elkanii]|uniref:DUF5681 domain-containing protein n=1 Tax=Bradyrhizobium elkanii TaxID=29448 RepID=UPI0004BB6486|nr:DUF5681 domain-containing protein [Bradyrhizobium elkanii]WLA79955.1 DUF5681 domain-containing protein [Bradyrhizobium elkanii]